jgi:hypothetical protein
MTAFLNAPMDYEVDVHLDKETVTVMQELAREIGMKELDDNTRKRIAKACYGLKQAPRQFYKDLSGYLKEIGFESHPVDECLFKRQRNGKTMWLIIFVDEMLIIGDDTQEVIEFKQELTLKYELKDLGLVEKFLGMRIERGEGWMKLGQEHYIKEMLE